MSSPQTREVQQGWNGQRFETGVKSESTRTVQQRQLPSGMWVTVDVSSQEGPIPRFGTYRPPKLGRPSQQQ